ncbi:MAG: fasciclin protein [Caulobacteraceae bacterium]|jgi:uncharacterized surface protein with fasciclin (FAS1) repeats|nr:fasciclin protein [Caulobacteraceae bacterium]
MSFSKSAWLALALSIGETTVAAAQTEPGQRELNQTELGQTDIGKTPMVGGAPMFPYRNIIQNAVESKDHTTLVAAVKAAGLVQTLEGPGPYTVFAPTNEAFEKLPPGTVAGLLKPENKAALVKVLTYHVVAGKLTEARLRSAIKAGGGMATLTTVEGEPLTVSLYDDRITLTDAKGGTSTVTIVNVMQSNGLIDVVDGVLTP